ncbi:MAG: hypothetical protein COV47_01250 [Candidatus Diapherotrites archaeon CG11_big_fil_rev_8_21_14_0_20_37_9]|nr:MAG: hypothetical protein COV47_01250 [Candidatus Diapherotrites archaeon CG11_big_fil_rev_8_21_14_0_20_37_9]
MPKKRKSISIEPMEKHENPTSQAGALNRAKRFIKTASEHPTLSTGEIKYTIKETIRILAP